ncbi:MAG: hypothetical protein ACOCV1_07115 [Bacillota bacterium]
MNKILIFTLTTNEEKVIKFIGKEVPVDYKSKLDKVDCINFDLNTEYDKYKKLFKTKSGEKLVLINYDKNKELKLIKKEISFNDIDSIPYDISSLSSLIDSIKKRQKEGLDIDEELLENKFFREKILSKSFLENKKINNNIVAEIILICDDINLQENLYRKKGKRYSPKKSLHKKLFKLIDNQISYLDEEIIDFILSLNDKFKNSYMKLIDKYKIRCKNISEYFRFRQIDKTINEEEIIYVINNFRHQIVTDKFWDNNKFRKEIVENLLLEFWGKKITSQYPNNILYKGLLKLGEGKLDFINNEIVEFILESKNKNIFIKKLNKEKLKYEDIETYVKINNRSILSVLGNNMFKDNFFKETPNNLVAEVLIEYSNIIAIDNYPNNWLYSKLLKLIDKKEFLIDLDIAKFISDLNRDNKEKLLELVINDKIEFADYKVYLKVYDNTKINHLLIELINGVEKNSNSYNIRKIFLEFHHKLYRYIGEQILEERENNNEFLYPIIPNCYFNSLTYCEGRKFGENNDYWCRNDPCHRTDLLKNLNINKKYQNWSLFEIFNYYSISIDFINIYELKGIRNLEDYITKIGGALNRLIELRDKLECEKCGKILNFNWEYAKNKAAYRLTVVYCNNDDCDKYKDGIYINHCWACGKIIDSREGSIKIEDRYLCVHCGSGPQKSYNYTQGSICPKCGSKNMHKDEYRNFTCRDCNHKITTPSPKSGRITGKNKPNF